MASALGPLSATIVRRVDELGGRENLESVLASTEGLTKSALNEVADYYQVERAPLEKYAKATTPTPTAPQNDSSVIDKSKTTTSFVVPDSSVTQDDVDLFASPSRFVSSKKTTPEPVIKHSSASERPTHDTKVSSAKPPSTTATFPCSVKIAGKDPQMVHIDPQAPLWPQLVASLDERVVSISVVVGNSGMTKVVPDEDVTAADYGVSGDMTVLVKTGPELTRLEKAGAALIDPDKAAKALGLLKGLSVEQLMGEVRENMGVTKNLVYLAARGGHLEALQHIEKAIGAPAFKALVNTPTNDGRYPISAAFHGRKKPDEIPRAVVAFLLARTDERNLTAKPKGMRSAQELAEEHKMDLVKKPTT